MNSNDSFETNKYANISLPGVNQSIVYFSQTDLKGFVSDLKGSTWIAVWRSIKHTIFNRVNSMKMKDLDCTLIAYICFFDCKSHVRFINSKSHFITYLLFIDRIECCIAVCCIFTVLLIRVHGLVPANCNSISFPQCYVWDNDIMDHGPWRQYCLNNY